MTSPVMTSPRVLSGRRMAAARKAAGFTQPQLAERLGVKKHTVAHLERGEYAHPSISTIYRYALAVRANVLEFFEPYFEVSYFEVSSDTPEELVS